VDRYLADAGRLVFIERPEDLQGKLVIEPRNRQESLGISASKSLQSIVGIITEFVINLYPKHDFWLKEMPGY